MLYKELIKVLACPITKRQLRYDEVKNILIEDESGNAYPVRDGIPILLENEAFKVK